MSSSSQAGLLAEIDRLGTNMLTVEAGRSFTEQKALLASRGVALDQWRRLAQHKLAELDEQIANARAAREAIDHALRCPHEDFRHCPTFRSLITARLAGQPLHEAHSHEPLRKATGPAPAGRPSTQRFQAACSAAAMP